MEANLILDSSKFTKMSAPVRQNSIEMFESVLGTIGGKTEYQFYDIAETRINQYLKRPRDVGNFLSL